MQLSTSNLIANSLSSSAKIRNALLVMQIASWWLMIQDPGKDNPKKS